MLDCSYAGAEGIREAFARGTDALAGMRLVEEKKMVEKLFRALDASPGTVAYGTADVLERLRANAAATILICDDANLRITKSACICGNPDEVILDAKNANDAVACHCGLVRVPDSLDLIDALAEESALYGTALEVVSGRSEHGAMLHSLGGIGAVLRYDARRGR